MIQGSSTDICKGDKISVIKGDLVGIKGQVISIDLDSGFVTFKPIGIEGFDQDLKLEASSIAKYFEAGDNVRVIDGKYRGETGIVVSSGTTDDHVAFTNIVLAQSSREVRVLANHLKLKSEIESSTAGGIGNSTLFMDKSKAPSY